MSLRVISFQNCKNMGSFGEGFITEQNPKQTLNANPVSYMKNQSHIKRWVRLTHILHILLLNLVWNPAFSAGYVPETSATIHALQKKHTKQNDNIQSFWTQQRQPKWYILLMREDIVEKSFFFFHNIFESIL